MGIGLDIGTCNLVCARKDVSGNVQIDSIRDAFLDIESDPAVLNMLKMSNVSYVQEGKSNSVYIVGEAALSVANLLKREARRPLSQGIVSAGEREAEKMLVILLSNLLKKSNAKIENENIYFSVPAPAIDKNMDVIYHQALFQKIIESFGYKATAMNEAAAIVYANAAKEGFTAMASSFGSGLTNSAILYKTMIGMSFSVSRAGDDIDIGAAKACGCTATRIMSIKEKGVNLMDPSEGDPMYLREREAICVYYKNMIIYVIDSIKKEFKKQSSSIELPGSIPWILSGGTSLARGFLEFFKKVFEGEKDSFPVKISEVRMATDPLNSVAQGLLIAAMNE